MVATVAQLAIEHLQQEGQEEPLNPDVPHTFTAAV